MFEQFEEDVKGRVLEVGAGIGTFSERLLAKPIDHLWAMEPWEPCVEALNRDFGSNERVTVVDEALPGAPSLEDQRGRIDFILCQNVLEHIGDDQGALDAMSAALRPGGRLHLLVPGNPRLYGPLDRSYGHFRRYTKAVVRERLMLAGLEVDDLYSFNALGIPGWWVQNRRGTNAEISSGSLRAYEALLKIWKPVEKRWRPPMGLSVIARAGKPA
ncbi:MAG: methyltransferase domain-containing protein [Actinobacteria bacterium]|nr:methyltransferase domain-containing protein [Actinomycetota bacterium]